MGSEQNDGTSYQPSEPKPCANNCGFFGTAGNRNLCSKCYRDFCIQEERAASAKAAMEKSLLNPTATAAAAAASSSIPPAATPDSAGRVGELSSSTEPQAVALKKAANRCGSCNKKVGLTGFMCKCGNTFCGTHRYPENHQCSYDFKGAGRDAISKANPVVKADKVERF